MIITTYTGSTYVLDMNARTWERTGTTWRSGDIRTEVGTIPKDAVIALGERMNLVRNDASFGIPISTSPVTAIQGAK